MPIDPGELIARMEWAAENDVRELFFCIGKTQVKIRRAQDSKPKPATAAPTSAAKSEAEGKPDTDAAIVSAPLAGLCHLGPEAGSKAFVSPGDSVSEGQTLCVIEAMKVMTSIPAPRAGKLDELLVADGTSVTVGTPLMRLV